MRYFWKNLVCSDLLVWS